VLARGEKIELLVDKTEALNQSAKKFQKSAKTLKNAMWWKNVKMWLMCVGGGLRQGAAAGTVALAVLLSAFRSTRHPTRAPLLCCAGSSCCWRSWGL
jgi:hypothetical protein